MVWTNRFKNLSYFLLGLLPLLFCAGILFLNDPLVWPDEAIYVDIAKNWLQTGVLKTNLFNNAVYGLKTIAAWYPPLYFYVLGFWIKLFGSGIVGVRFLSLIIAVFTLFLTYFLAKRLLNSSKLALTVMLLVSFDYFFNRSARIARMDMFNLLFLLISFCLVFFKQPASFRQLFFTGIFSGLAVLSHPLGLISAVVITGWLMLNDLKVKLKKIVVFLLPTFLLPGIWLWSLKPYWQIFWQQWGLQIDRKNHFATYLYTLWQGQDLSWRLLLGLYLLIFILLAGAVFYKKNNTNLFILLGLSVSSVMLLYGKEMFYPLYLQPFIGLGTVYLFALFTQNNHELKPFAQLVIGLIFFLHIHFFLQTYNLNYDNNFNYHLFGQTIKQNLPNKGTLYLSALPDPYFALQENPEFIFLEFPTMYTTDKQYYSLLDKADYVIYNQLFDSRLPAYLKINQDSSQTLKAGNYDIILAKLKPITKRQWPKK